MKRRYFISLVVVATTTIAISQLAIAQDHSPIVPFKPISADEKAIVAMFVARSVQEFPSQFSDHRIGHC
jgi:hypothetical protein